MIMETSDATPQVMVITGTSKGLGKGIAIHYLGQGFLVAGCSRGEATIEHENYFHSCVDIGDEGQVQRWVKAVKKLFKRIDVLVCNAGVLNSFSHLALTPGSLLKSFLNTNVSGTFYVCREVSKIMLLQRHGSIITISSIMTNLHEPGTAAYSLSKSAINEMTKVLAKELAPMNINCNIISPSFIVTDATNDFGKEYARIVLEKQTIKRPVTIEEVCNIIRFFSAPESRCVTGQDIHMGLVC
jgi:3-oxoacyl-[acyl-carrier protein] reductase